MSSIDPSLKSPIKPFFISKSSISESPHIQDLIKHFNLQKHPEGGYFVETDRDPRRVPNPFLTSAGGQIQDDPTRNASTTIYYLLTPGTPKGVFHRNKGRTVHTLQEGRGRYVIIHEDEQAVGQTCRVETFVVGHDRGAGERSQWVVEGGKYKASFLLPDREGSSESNGLLISETVVPGFEFSDHNFMPPKKLPELVTRRQSEELSWLLSENQ